MEDASLGQIICHRPDGHAALALPSSNAGHQSPCEAADQLLCSQIPRSAAHFTLAFPHSKSSSCIPCRAQVQASKDLPLQNQPQHQLILKQGLLLHFLLSAV